MHNEINKISIIEMHLVIFEIAHAYAKSRIINCEVINVLSLMALLKSGFIIASCHLKNNHPLLIRRSIYARNKRFTIE